MDFAPERVRKVDKEYSQEDGLKDGEDSR